MNSFLRSTLLALTVALPLATRAQCPAVGTEIRVGTGTITKTPGFDLPAGTTTWTRNNIYVLDGTVYVPSGATLTIEAGTIVKGDKANQGTLVVQRGGRLIANGTATQPIVFTSSVVAGSRQPGDWGGIILLGRAPINLAGSPSIEGAAFGTKGEFGGTDPADNSGSLQYVRIEFPGIAFQVNNEVNGLTMGGVGHGTTINHVQVSNSGDDAFEWFGGTVNAKYLVAQSSVDDDYDTDNGFSGRVQFALALRDPSRGDIATGGVSNGVESDNDANGTATTLLTSSVFSNFTILLPPATSPASPFNNAAGLLIRRNSSQSVFNSIVAGRRFGVELNSNSSNLTQTNAQSGSLVLANNIFIDVPFTATNFTTSRAGRSSYSSGVTPLAGFLINEFVATGNDTTQTIATLGLNADNYNFEGNCSANRACVPVFGLPAASPATTGAAFTNTKLTGAGNGGPNNTFDVVSFRGAFGPAGTAAGTWANGWTNFNPQITCYNVAGQTLSNRTVINAPLEALTVSPNPTEGAAALGFNVKRATTATVRVLDVLGREVASVLKAGKLAAGPQSLALPATLAPGVYIATVATTEGVQSVRFVVTK